MTDYLGRILRRSDGVEVASATAAVESASAWDNIIEDELISGDLWLPEGQRTLFRGHVEVEGHILGRAPGTVLGARPPAGGGKTRISILGGDPSAYVGGGMTYDTGPDAPYTNDRGIWLWDEAQADVLGTEKVGWIRGDPADEPTWDLQTDELWIAPTDVGDLQPRRWFPGDPIPRVPVPSNARIPPGFPAEWLTEGIPAEIVNVTRDVVIEATGAGHIHIHSQVPQRVEYARIEHMGVYRLDGTGQVLGRYALHQHMAGDGSRGSIWRGVAIVDSQGRGFVPHASHGYTLEDCVALNSRRDPLWWDIGDDTNDLLVDHMAVLGVSSTRDLEGGFVDIDGFVLGSGLNMEIRNSFAAGVRGSKLCTGFKWVSGGTAPNPVWIFDTSNLAHNNRLGLRFWTNLEHEHPVLDYLSYRNEEAGIQNGAYHNRVRYTDVLSFDEKLEHHSNTKDAPVGRYLRVDVFSPSEAIRIGQRQKVAGDYQRFEDMTLEGDPPVYVEAPKSRTKPWKAHFIHCGIIPSDIKWGDATDPLEQGSHVLIDHEDGRSWEILVDGGKPVVTEV